MSNLHTLEDVQEFLLSSAEKLCEGRHLAMDRESLAIAIEYAYKAGNMAGYVEGYDAASAAYQRALGQEPLKVRIAN